MSERKCAICGCDISNRNTNTKICLALSCRKAHYSKQKTCRFCGKPFMAMGRSLDCGSPACLSERNKVNNKNRRSKLPVSPSKVASLDFPEGKYATTYTVYSKSVPRGHAGTHLSLNEDAASLDCAWLFKGRKPEKPGQILEITRELSKPQGGWKAMNERQKEYHLRKKTKPAIV